MRGPGPWREEGEVGLGILGRSLWAWLGSWKQSDPLGRVRSDQIWYFKGSLWLWSAEWIRAAERGSSGVGGCHGIQGRDRGPGARAEFYTSALLTCGAQSSWSWCRMCSGIPGIYTQERRQPTISPGVLPVSPGLWRATWPLTRTVGLQYW